MATVHPSGPGKTAPRIHADFLQFDPQKSSNANLLADNAPIVGDGPAYAPRRDACAHDYTVKSNQSIAPPLDGRPDASTQYKLALVCKKCRIHADIRIAYYQATHPCPTAESQLHHFQRALHFDHSDHTQIRYGWQCSTVSCKALLSIAFKLPRISDSDRMLLTDTGKLKSRFDAVMESEPTREGLRQATPVDALSRLRKYIKDSLNTEHDRRSFPANNKRFMEAFGVYGRDCEDMLEGLGFRYTYAPEDASWSLPAPPSIPDRLNSEGGNLRERLEDVEYELRALMSRLSSENNLPNPASGEGWSSANRDIERTLAAQGYPRYTTLRRANGAYLEPYFAGLGALPDFSDTLIAFAFDKQAECDVLNRSYYYECLQWISNARETEELQMKAAMVESAGLVSRRDLRDALNYFDFGQSPSASDDQILGRFQARQSDLGPSEQERCREMLGRIGKARGSQMLTKAAQQSIETVEEAYAWLGQGVGPQTEDAMVTTVFAIRTDNDKNLEEIGRKAVSAIAKERKSDYLNTWLLGGDTAQTQMSVQEALRLLEIETELSSVEATLWPSVFENAREHRPGSQTEQAIATIRKALAGETMDSSGAYAPETWPVGLTSHGNTCYLNSLLQYYFSLKPLREIVLHYDQYKMDTAANAEKLERVGQRKVSMKEIKGGQKFADELRHLFQRMIKDRGPSVKPEQDLVCRAFLDPKDFDELERQNPNDESAVDDSAPAGPTTNGVASEEHSQETADSSASSVTLQASPVAEDGDVQMKSGDMPPTPPESPSTKPLDSKAENPPPLPPRRFSTTTSDTLRQAQEKAKEQQDVTEVHDSITQRLRAGMQPQGADARGEQKDALRDLFSVGMTQTTLSDASDQAPTKPEEFTDSSIQLNVPSEPTDLYSALDDFFDPSEISEASQKQQYKSINKVSTFLQINMPRIGFDKATGQAFKSDKSLRLEDELYLDRYCDNSDVLTRRRLAWDWRRKLKEMKKEQRAYSKTPIDLDGPDAVAETAKYIKSLDDVNRDLVAMGEEPIETDSELYEALTADASFQTERLKSLDADIADIQAKLKDTFDDMKTVKYRLHAVFFHRGATTHGHYWISIHDFQHDVWRNYNDENVSEMPKDKLHQIFEANEWQHGTPTYAVYVRDDCKDTHVQAVCRAPEPAPEPESTDAEGGWQDIKMEDAAPAADGTVNPKEIFQGGHGDWDAHKAEPSYQWPPNSDKAVTGQPRFDSLWPSGDELDADVSAMSLGEGEVEMLKTVLSPSFQGFV